MTTLKSNSGSFSGNDIGEMFLRFFERKKGADGKAHKRRCRSSLVPHWDHAPLLTTVPAQ